MHHKEYIWCCVPNTNLLSEKARELTFFTTASQDVRRNINMPDRCKEAKQALYAEDYQMALLLYEDHLNSWGDLREVWAGLALCYYFTGDHDNALYYADCIVNSGGSSSDTWYSRWKDFRDHLTAVLDQQHPSDLSLPKNNTDSSDSPDSRMFFDPTCNVSKHTDWDED